MHGSHRVEPKCFLLTSIVQLLTECIFWTRPAGACLSAPKICLSLPWTEKAPARRGVSASRGKSRQSGSKVRPFPLCREHRAEHFLSGVVAVTGPCSSLPNICSLKPRQAPQTLGPKAHLLRRMNEPVTLCLVGGYAGLAWVLFVCHRRSP